MWSVQLAGHARAARRGQRAAAAVVGLGVRRVAAGGHVQARLQELPAHALRPAALLPGQAGPARRRRVHRHQVSTPHERTHHNKTYYLVVEFRNVFVGQYINYIFIHI